MKEVLSWKREEIGNAHSRERTRPVKFELTVGCEALGKEAGTINAAGDSLKQYFHGHSKAKPQKGFTTTIMTITTISRVGISFMKRKKRCFLRRLSAANSRTHTAQNP